MLVTASFMATIAVILVAISFFVTPERRELWLLFAILALLFALLAGVLRIGNILNDRFKRR